MENFKSFGKKLTVPFFKGFTAITGPNGSGKSNIVDAILFVLGPKSSKVMRAGRLTDLIFNGGKKQKNPAKYCKVSLVFDNSARKMPVDSNEVVLTRMIKRAPIKNNPDNYYSYFYINDKSASYSDFINVLTHARISGDGYNIVKQGDVTSIIEMGAVDRRRIIDDIAGISSFDNDIKKAEQEKIEAEGNIDRINIILNEISSQIRTLKKERDEAYRYKELKGQLYETKAKIALKKKMDVENQISEIQQQIKTYEDEQKKLDEQRQQLKKTYGETQNKLEDVEQHIANVGGDESKELKEKIDELRKEEVKIEEKINYSNDEIVEHRQDLERLQTTLDDITKELQEHEEQLHILSEDVTQQEETLETKEQKLTDLKETVAQSDDKSMDITRELVKMREEFNELQNTLHEKKLKRDRITDNIESLNVQIAEIEETKGTYEFELKDIDWQKEELLKDNQSQQKKLKKYEQQHVELKRKETEFVDQLNDLEQAIRRLQREQSQLQAENEALQTIQSKYHPAVNAVLAARDNGELKGVHGTIAELAKVDKKYETAMEIAAGGRMQSVVVKDDAAAAEAISFLRKKKLGRATFLPMNKMIEGKPRGKALMAVKDPSAHGFAIDLVDFNPEYTGAFWYVFGDTIIVNSLNDARRLMGGVRLVDTNGDLVEASGAMVGGSKPKMLLSFGSADTKKLDEIKKQVLAATTSQETVEKELTDIRKQLADIEQNLREIKGGSDVTSQVKELEVRKKEYTAKLEVVNQDLEQKQQQKEQFDQEHDELIKAIRTLEKRTQEIDQLKDEKGKHLLQGTKKELAQEIRSLEQEISELQEQVLEKRSKQETLSKKMELIEERKDEITQKIEDHKLAVEQFKKQTHELKQQRSTCQDELKTLMNVEQQMSGKIKEFADKRDQLYKKSITIENDLDKLNTRLESYLDLISRAKYRLPTLEGTIEELDQEMALYQVEIADTKLPNVETLKDSMRVIEDTMQELEPVNMRALEEYDHQMERKTKFDEDVKHLKDQKKNLTKLVNEIVEQKKERFFEVFNEINKNFKVMYSQLSEGGEAELELENEENVFESGLTVRARPRGKKVLRLEALSGGEKSIASLGFIFAIQQYDPSPFYVLDEVDMFLDGVNAETVSRMIKNNALHSQFITVSLRKIVLKEANQVYGVTMQNQGISQMIGNINPDTVSPTGEIHTEEVKTHAIADR